MSENQKFAETLNENMDAKMSVTDLTQIAVFAAIIAVLSQLSIPMPAGVPMTLQTLIIPFSGIILGRKKGTCATLLYLLIGAVGIPVFSGFSGGLGILLGMTGGFLVSFPVLSYTAGLADKIGLSSPAFKNGKKGFYYVILVLGLLIGAVINYLFGTVWFMIATGSDFAYSFAACVLPFIPTALIKIAVIAIIGPELKKRLARVIG